MANYPFDMNIDTLVVKSGITTAMLNTLTESQRVFFANELVWEIIGGNNEKEINENAGVLLDAQYLKRNKDEILALYDRALRYTGKGRRIGRGASTISTMDINELLRQLFDM
jgi:hypothetical protein